MLCDIKKILVPLDLSETSLNAFRTAAFLATKWDAAIVIINVQEAILDFNKRKQLHSPYYSNPEVLNALIETLRQNKINSRLIQTDGAVTDSIVNAAIEEKADIIFMGAHGASGMRNGFMGTNAYSVIKYAASPVFTIPARVKPQAFKKILYPILPVADAFSAYGTIRNFFDKETVLDVLGLSSLKMERKTNILDDIVDKIKPFLEQDNIKAATSWANGGTISDEIISFSKMTLPDLIVLTSMIDTIYKSDFIGPHSQKILNCSRVPILCVR